MDTRPYLGVNVSLSSIDEMLHRGLLEEGETVLALFDGVLLDENRRRVGGLALADFVALTDQRLITWARGLFNDTVDSFPWSDVDVARAESWDPWHGRVSMAFRLPAVAPRQRRIVVKGIAEDTGSAERVLINTLDYMPADDVNALAKIIGWVGDQVLAGLGGAELVAAFGEAFPAPEPKPAPAFFSPPQMTMPIPPPPPEPVAPPAARRRWWQTAPVAEPQPPTGTPANLISAYEQQRSGAPAGDGGASATMPGPIGPLPMLPEQPSMYEVSRSLRLFLEAPRKLARGLRRASEMVHGTSELVSGMQDPQVRRNAMRGIYHAAAQQELAGGPLAPVAPVVRAAVRFSEPLEDPAAAEAQQARRIQVRPTARQSAPPAVAEPPAPANTAAPQPIKRSISVRRVETVAAPAAAPEPAAPEPARAPVRRLVVSRGSNGYHPQDEGDAE